MLDFSTNQLEGSVSSDIGNAKSLSQLILHDNKFSGELPASEISRASKLNTIDLGNNQFSGEIPAKIGDLKQLDCLYLQNNRFSGPLPESLASCESLTYINLAHNSLTGTIPESLGNLPTLTFLNLSHNQISGQIPKKLSSLRLSLLDLSNNRLTGSIPETLSIDAYNDSFSDNDGLCSRNMKNFRRCPRTYRGWRLIHLAFICILALGVIVLLVCLTRFVYLKKKIPPEYTNSWKSDSIIDNKLFYTTSGLSKDKFTAGKKNLNQESRSV